MKRLPRRLTVLFLAMAMPTYGFVALDAAEDFAEASDNVEHVKQLEYEDRYGDGPNQGSDLEFLTLTLPADRAADLAQSGEVPPDGDPHTPGIQRTYAFAGAYDNGLQIVDVTDPEDAEIIAVYDCGISQGDVQAFIREDLDGRAFVTFTHDTGYSAQNQSTCMRDVPEARLQGGFGTFIAEVTDPYAPTTISWVPVEKGSHNQTVHPSGQYLYNSNSDLITSAASAGIEIFDITDLEAPESLGQLDLPVRPGIGTESHDLTFSEDGTRAYSAALSQTVIIDTSDPAEPEIISSIYDPAINVEHQSNPVTLTDETTGLVRDFLIIEDEFAGAAGAEQTCPSGGVHVYDITGDLEKTPVKVGYWNTDDIHHLPTGFGRCTAHVFEIHPDEALMTIAYYNIGVRVVDLSGLIGVALGGNGVGMKELAFAWFDDSDTWAVKAPYVDRDGVFYIYGNDQARGMDIYRVDLGDTEATEAVDPGTWLSPSEALQQAQLAPSVDLSSYTPYCLLGDRGSLG